MRKFTLTALCGGLLTVFCSPLQAASLNIKVVGSDAAPLPSAVVSVVGAEVAASQAAAVESAPAVEIDQRGKRFVSHVTVVAPGREVNFPNSDDIRHSVYSFSGDNSFELKLYRANDAPPVSFAHQGIVKLGCNIHDNMKAYVVVSNNPTVQVTDDNGNARLDHSTLVAGVDLEFWHPQLEQPLIYRVSDALLASAEGLEIMLPVIWEDPQAPRSLNKLEQMLKSYAEQGK